MLELRSGLVVEPVDYPASVAGYIEEKDGELFWVKAFFEGSQDAHSLSFDKVVPVGEIGRSYYKNGALAAYVCVPEEGPVSLNAVTEAALWFEHLKDEANRKILEDFLFYERQ